MTLKEYLQTLDVVAKKAVEDSLAIMWTDIGIRGQFVINLAQECRLDDVAWSKITDALVSAPQDAGNLEATARSWCQRHTLRGGAIPLPWPVLLGRAITREIFYDFLVTQGYVSTIERARYLVRRLIAGHFTHLQGKPLSPYAMWATFNQSNSSDDPFGLLPPNADGIRAELGLSKNDQTKDLVLLFYQLPASTAPHFPTVADAYAGSVWVYFFRPGQPDDLHGWTMSWEGTAQRRPEVIHNSITGDSLTHPARIAKG